MITNNYSAEYGRVAGAVISLVSRSGSNQFHGHAWEYLSREALNANNATLDSPAFGGVTATLNPREMQLGFRFSF